MNNKDKYDTNIPRTHSMSQSQQSSHKPIDNLALVHNITQIHNKYPIHMNSKYSYNSIGLHSTYLLSNLILVEMVQ